jgi:hypothetical protein
MAIPFSLVIAFVLFAVMGGVMLWRPQYLTRLTHVELATAESRNEARAVYGGFGIGMAVALFIATVYSPLRGGIMLTTGLALIGMAAGRGYSGWLERPSTAVWSFLILEAVLGFLLFFRI